MRSQILALIVILGLVFGGETYYLSILSTQLVSSQDEISRLNKILDKYGRGRTIRIGAIAPSTEDLNSWKATLSLAEEDINSYLKDIGYNYTFDFLMDDAQGSASAHLEKVQNFKSMGVKIIIGGGWSSEADASLPYMNMNDMLLVSPSSTAASQSLIMVDNFFRLCPNDFVQAPVLAEMWKSWGIETVIIFYSLDTWGEGLLQLMNSELSKRNIEVLEAVGYSPETLNFTSYLAHMDDLAAAAIEKYGDKRYVGVQIFSFNEQTKFLSQAEQFPNIKDLIWFSTESGGRNQAYIDQVGEPLVSKRMFSPLMRADETSPKWISLDTRYGVLTGKPTDFFTGTLYDSAWLVALSVLESESLSGDKVAATIRDVASKTYGVTGWLKLDEYGDREPQVFDIWGYYRDLSNNTIMFRKFGEYNGQAANIIWDYKALNDAGAIIFR